MTPASFVSLLVLVLTQAAPASQPPRVPWCGSPPDRDIGRGFRFTQYMFDGSDEFRMTFEPSAKSVSTNGVEMTAPFKLQFIQMDLKERTPAMAGLAGPHIGFTSYEFRKPDGSRLGIGALKLECGGGTILSERYLDPVPHNGPVSMDIAFFNQPEQQCLAELTQNGRFRFTIGGRDFTNPYVVIDDLIPLRWAMDEVRRIWTAELAKAKQGQCRLMPPPPPPF